MNNLQESIVNAMEMVAGEYLTRAGYDRTIQATVLACVDEATGKYRIKYLDSKFYAYAANVETKYADNSQVYILIPGNDMTMHKTILGSVKNEGLYGSKVLPKSAHYLDYGINLIELKKDFGLCSYKSKERSSYVEINVEGISLDINPKENLWYNYNLEEEEYILTEDESILSGKDYYYLLIDNLNLILIFSEKDINKSSDPEKDIYYETDKVKINLAGIKEYILDNSSVDTLKIGGVFATKLPEEQRRLGNYGLNFVFTGKLAGETATREFTMTIQDMEGDPYRYFVDSELTTYLELGDFTFEKLKSITFYAEDFPVIDFDNPHSNDIFLKGIIFLGCEALTNEEVRGVYLKLTTPQGTIFYPYKDMLLLSLIAEVYNGGTPVKSDSNSLGYYWFEERATVKDDIGGKGWYSLNGVDTTTGKAVPSSNIYNVKKSDIPFYSKTYLSVAIYNALKFSKIVLVLNYEAKYKMELSTPKTIFNEKETASAEIELKLYHRDYPSLNWEPIEDFSNFIIKWYGEDSYKNYRELEYSNIKKVSISDFNKFYKVHCTVEKRDDKAICGSETLTLTKVSGTNEPFTLEIINDNGDFVYNEEGIAPTNASLGNPIAILPLRFSIYDNINGINIDTSSIPAEKIIWRFPLKSESLISPLAGEEQDGYLVLNGNEVGFTLDDTYSIELNVNNRVYLDVVYGKYSLRTWIDIHCRKEGENGTNGTGYSLTIEPTSDIFGKSLIPIIRFYKDGEYFTPLDEYNNSNWFNVSLWLHGERVFTGSMEGLGVKDDDDSIYKIKWEFKQHTQNGWQENSFYRVEGNIFSINLDNQNHLCDSNGLLITEGNRRECLEKSCHILQVTVEYKGLTIIASLPIGTLFIESEDSNNKTINLKSGFKEVIYRADGTLVKYRNNTPLTLWYLSEGKWENISEDEVTWEACGKYPVVNGSTTEWIESNDLVLKGEEPNEYLSPVDTYSGFCYTNAAVANINIKYGNSSSNAFIHLPIHFYLNRYENKAINGWDGNAININEEDGIILSPQIGAGKKELDNSFTGVVIGVSKVIDDDSGSRQEKINTGLFGYTHGQLSIFLDSETGSATFGIEKVGQIKINPGINDYGLFNADPNILSGSYQSKASSKEGRGLSIGFGIKPYITYGSRKFTVDPEGNVVMLDATVEGCFFAKNKNTEDESEILIGTDPTNTNKLRASHIYLYDYYKDELDDLKQLSYIKIKPGNLDVTVKDIAAEDSDTKDEKDKSYLRFDADKGLLLKGEFRCKTYNTDVVFSNSSYDTQIEFWSYQDDDLIKSDLTSIENQKINLYQTFVVSEAIPAAREVLTIRYTNLHDLYKEDCPYSNEEIEDFIKSWVRDYEILVENQGTYNEIINLTQNLIGLLNNENNLKLLISGKRELIKNRENEKVVNGEFVDDGKLASINSDIISYENEINDLISLIKNIQNLKKNIEDAIEQKLIFVGYHLIGNREYQDFVDEVGTSPSFDIVKKAYEFYSIHTLLNYGSFVPLLKVDSFSFDLAGIINEAFIISSKITAANAYKNYIVELKKKEKAKKAIEDAEHPLKTKSLWSPSEFYFNVYDDEGEDVISGISYNSETKNLTYIGGVDFEAPPYARLKMTTDKYKDSNYDAGETKGENASELYFKTFFLNETGELDIANPKSLIVLKAGYLKVGAKLEPQAAESSLTMRNGKLELKNVEFAIKTYASDIAFTNKPSTTHIRLYNYERDIIEGEEEKSLKSSVRITPFLFAVQGTASSLHYNPNNGRLNYTGNINVSNDKGLFRLDLNDMVLRFGTTVGDYVLTEEDEVDERFSGVPKNSKVTDFRLSSNGFSIRSYGKKTTKSIETNNQIDYSDKNAKSAAEQWQDFVNSKEPSMSESSINRIIESFGKEIITEDNILTDNPQAFEENYWANFTVPESEINSWNNSDLSEQESSISVPIHDFKKVETGGDYALNSAGEYEYVGEGNGDYVWQDAGAETINVPLVGLPSFLESDERININDGSEVAKTWAETSGLYYNAKTGKFRLNGDFAVRNDHGSVILSDDLMRIMFKTYEKNDNGTDSDQVATRMCISEDSFYFYSFGEVKIAPAESDITDDKHGKVYCDNFRTIEHGITGAITWRDGILRIIGSIYADSGYIGGWTIERLRLSSSSGNAVLDGATGNLFLSNGSSSGGGTTKGDNPAGQVCSEFGNRRSRIAYGQFFIEGIGESAELSEAHSNANSTLQEAIEDLKELCEILNLDSNNQKYKIETYVSNKQRSNAKIVPSLVDIENYDLNKKQIENLYNKVIHESTYSEEAKNQANVLKTVYDTYTKALGEYKKIFTDNAEETEYGITYWGHLAHLISGYGAALGAMLASEGYRELNGENSSPAGKTEWYNPLEKGTPLTEISYIEDGQDYSYNNVNFGIGVNFENKYNEGVPSEEFKEESVNKCVASFIRLCSPENKSDTIASLSFVQKRENNGFIYGTEIFPHVVKTKDVFLTDPELQGEYNSSSLVGMLKELHLIPKKITYIDKETETSEYPPLEGYSLLPNDNTAYIVEEWERESKYYKMSEETDERGIHALERKNVKALGEEESESSTIQTGELSDITSNADETSSNSSEGQKSNSIVDTLNDTINNVNNAANMASDVIKASQNESEDEEFAKTEYKVWKLTLEPSEDGEEVDVKSISLLNEDNTEGMSVDLSGFVVHLPC